MLEMERVQKGKEIELYANTTTHDQIKKGYSLEPIPELVSEKKTNNEEEKKDFSDELPSTHEDSDDEHDQKNSIFRNSDIC